MYTSTYYGYIYYSPNPTKYLQFGSLSIQVSELHQN